MQSNFFESYILISSSIAIIGLGILYYAFNVNKNIYVIRIGILFVVQLILLIISQIMYDVNEDKRMRKRVIDIIDNKSFQILLNGNILDSTKKRAFAKDLKLIKNISAHHSHPIDTIETQIISSKDTINLIIGQDSQDSTEYWAFIYTDHNFRRYEIGRFYSRTFLIKNEL